MERSYEEICEGVEHNFNYAITVMNLNISQAIFYAEEYLDAPYLPYEEYVVHYVALMKFGMDKGFILTKDEKDGEYLFDEVGRKYYLSMDKILNLNLSNKFRSDLEAVINMYGELFADE